MEKYNDCCVVSVAFREPYVTHSNRQYDIIKKDSPNINFSLFIDRLPYAEGMEHENVVGRFQKSLYGFKPHTIQKVIHEYSYKKIIWFDPSVLPVTSVKVLFDSLDDHPMIVRTGDSPLGKMCNEKSKKWFGVTDEDIKDVKHIGGTIYGFNFNNEKVREVFELWKRAEECGIFGDQDEFMKGSHWCDESCMALAMYKIGIPQYWESKFEYLNQKDLA